MRICIVSGIFYPEIGGPATHLYNLCFELVKNGNEICVISYGDIKEDCNYPFPIKRISRKTPFLLRLLKFTYQVIKIGKNCDVFYVDHYGFPAALVNLFLRKPMIIRICGDFAWEYACRHKLTTENINEFQNKKHSLSVEIMKAIQYFYTKRANRVIVPSNYLKSIVSGWGIPSHKIDIVYNALREADFRISLSQAEARKEIGANSGMLMLVIARLVPWKGIDGLIKILPRFNKETQLMVVGDGPDMPRLRNLVYSLGMGKQVIFKGQILHHRVSLYLRAADIFMLPSLYEGLPHTILEAMIVGIPIVATNIGGIPEIIEDGKEGFLFEPGDSSGLEKLINRLAGERFTTLRLVNNAKEKIKQFNWDTLAEKIIRILDLAVKK